MNLQPMSPHPFTASGATFRVYCFRCSTATPSPDARCDLDAPAGTFYCPHCADLLTAGA